jgi:hypothetical protein
MANIYENAVLALGVTAFVSDSKGLFSASSSNHDPVDLMGRRREGKNSSCWPGSNLTTNYTNSFIQTWVYILGAIPFNWVSPLHCPETRLGM